MSERGGSSDDFPSITFRSTWSGVADFDVTPPAIAVSSERARRLLHPKGMYQLQFAVSVDDAGGTVSYSLVVIDPRKPLVPLGSTSGETNAGRVAIAKRVRPTTRTRVLRLEIDSTDPVGNHSCS